MSNDTRTADQRADHRHIWYVVRRFMTVTGRRKELLGCRACKATRGRFLKEQSK